MRPFGIVPEQMFHKANVESGRIEEFWFVVVNILLLDTPTGLLIGAGIPVSFYQKCSYFSVHLYTFLSKIDNINHGTTPAPRCAPRSLAGRILVRPV